MVKRPKKRTYIFANNIEEKEVQKDSLKYLEKFKRATYG